MPGAVPAGGSPIREGTRYSPRKEEKKIASPLRKAPEEIKVEAYVPGSPGGTRVKEKHLEEAEKKIEDNIEYKEYLRKSAEKLRRS